MTRISVSSSNLRSAGYEPASATLEVEFLHGGVYQYFDVPKARYAGLMTARSKGRFFDAFIKNGGYAYQRIA